MTNKILNINFEKKQIDDSGIFSGYASNFGNIDSHNDIIMPGAFSNVKDINNINLLWQHDKKKPIGKIIEITEDDSGLFVTAKLFTNSPYGSKAYKMLKKGILNGLSIGYRVMDSVRNAAQVRIIKDIDLYEISLVHFPSNDKSRVLEVKDAKDLKDLVKSLDQAICTLRS